MACSAKRMLAAALCIAVVQMHVLAADSAVPSVVCAASDGEEHVLVPTANTRSGTRALAKTFKAVRNTCATWSKDDGTLGQVAARAACHVHTALLTHTHTHTHLLGAGMHMRS